MSVGRAGDSVREGNAPLGRGELRNPKMPSGRTTTHVCQWKRRKSIAQLFPTANIIFMTLSNHHCKPSLIGGQEILGPAKQEVNATLNELRLIATCWTKNMTAMAKIKEENDKNTGQN